MNRYKEHFVKILEFTNTYDSLINCHLVDFIVQDLWEKCLPKLLRLELEQSKSEIDCWIKNDNSPELNNFISLTRLLSLELCPGVQNLKDVLDTFPDCTEDVPLTETNFKDINTAFMNPKKFHEVSIFGDLVARIAASSNSLVIDAGAGKAYLSTFLAEYHKIPVLAIDSSKVCHKGATDRHQKLRRKNKESQSLVRYVVEEINENTNYVKMVKDNHPDWNIDKNLLVTGLHTCGALAHLVIRAFLSTEDITSLCLIPCCYHLTDKTFDENCSFSKNARMLAQQSIERTAESKSVSPSLFYRAVLQVLLQSMGLNEVRVGRGGPAYDFPSYAKWALQRIGIESKKIPSADDLESFYKSHAHLKRRFNIFQTLRIHLAPVLEAAIMLDRIIFLEDSAQCSKLAVLRLFDPVLSPRRYAIIAIK